jgi:hypothetical protein
MKIAERSSVSFIYYPPSSICDLLVSPPCDEPGFLAAQVFAVAAETGWPEERIIFMPLARLAQYQHCLLRRNGVRTHWSNSSGRGSKPRTSHSNARPAIRRQ